MPSHAVSVRTNRRSDHRQCVGAKKNLDVGEQAGLTTHTEAIAEGHEGHAAIVVDDGQALTSQAPG